ncbi:MAG: DUF4132 domain-containing protein [Actinomycetota bacterium]
MRALPWPCGWSDEHVEEWATAVLPELTAVIHAGAAEWPDRVEKYFDAVALLPALPTDLREILVSHGVGGRKALRPLARAALERHNETVTDVAERLTSRKYEEREQAAHWLQQVGAKGAVPHLRRAAQKEQHDAALGAQLGALERFDEPIDAYLGHDKLLARAAQARKQGMPSSGSWIPMEHLPTLRWRDGTAVEQPIVDWLVIRAIRSKSPAASPIARRLFSLMPSESVDDFATTLLDWWITEDVKIDDEAQLVRELGLQGLTSGRQDLELVLRYLRPGATGSAISSKGLLSLVAAGGGTAVVEPVHAYLRDWYGIRASQCRALIEMLAWIDDPEAVQLVLSIGSRFRTKSIRDEAARQAEAIADRKGWTIDDLADRTVPTGGLDGDGRLVLDFGGRQFLAEVSDVGKLTLSDGAGKQLRSLPAPRADDDQALAAQAKKELGAARKAVSAAGKQLPRRLHDSMCVERRLPVDDFRRYMLRHSLVVRFVARLVWVAVTPERRVLFRPRVDGTLVDPDDDVLDLGDADHIGVAHGLLDGDEQAESWRGHFNRHGITALFPQFERPSLPELSDGQMELDRGRGAIIDNRKLRSTAQQLGFVLGPTADAGRIFEVVRSNVSADVEVRVSVRGLRAAVDEAEVAIESLGFGRIGAHGRAPLSEIPPVLLVESLAAVDRIVAAGEGIDPDWERRIHP